MTLRGSAAPPGEQGVDGTAKVAMKPPEGLVVFRLGRRDARVIMRTPVMHPHLRRPLRIGEGLEPFTWPPSADTEVPRRRRPVPARTFAHLGPI